MKRLEARVARLERELQESVAVTVALVQVTQMMLGGLAEATGVTRADIVARLADTGTQRRVMIDSLAAMEGALLAPSLPAPTGLSSREQARRIVQTARQALRLAESGGASEH